MHFKINKNTLIDALNISTKAISSKTTLPILSGILIEAHDNHLNIIGNDLNLGIETTIEANIFEEGAVVVDGSLFTTIINKLPNAIVDIHYTDHMVNIVCDDIKFDLVGTPADEYPEIPTIEKQNTYTFNSKLLKNMIKQTLFAVSTDEARPILTGVLFKIKNNNLTLVALDGYRLAYKQAAIEKLIENTAVIPGKTLNELNKILNDDSKLEISFTDKHILFNVDHVKIISRLLEGDFINYEQIIPTSFKSEMIIDTNEFRHAIERALLLSIKSSKSSIKFEIDQRHLTIRSNSETGKMEEELKIKYNGDALKIGFNPTYILDVLKVIDSEKIKINFNNNMSPAIIKGLGDDQYKYMVLPVRLSE
jgi:DNA polymerase-3 subunit beta